MSGLAPLPRRTALALGFGAVGGLALGCSAADPEEPGDGTSPPVAESAGRAPTTAGEDSDEGLVTEVLAAIAATRALVVAVRRQQPSLASGLSPLVVVHRAHGRALGGLPAAGDLLAAPAPAGRPAAARRQVVRAEVALQRQLTRASVSARSGALAGLLASAAASLAQQLAVLTAEDAAGA